MFLPVCVSCFIQGAINRLIRFWAKVALRLKWRVVSDDSICLLSLPGSSDMFPRIEVEARIACFREMVVKMKFYGISFREVDIDPLAFWEALKDLGRMLRDEVDRFFQASYFGRQMTKWYTQALAEALGLVHRQTVCVRMVRCD